MSELTLDLNDFIVVAYGDHEREYLPLKSTIEKKPAYVGLLGSRTKVTTFVQKLRAEGVSEAHLTALHH